MDQASPQSMNDDAPLFADRDERLPKVVVHFLVTPGATLTWSVKMDSTLDVKGARLWLTRISSPYDYWIVPGQPNFSVAARRAHMAKCGRRARR